MSVKTYFVTEAYRNWVQPKDIVREFKGDDCGIAKEDSMLHGGRFVAVTRNRDGSAPFFTVPEYCLDPLTEH